MEDLTKRYKEPHDVISREVEIKDVKRVELEGDILRKLCFRPVGMYSGGLAVAHQQITNKDPLRFFVLKTGEIIINAKIIRHTNHTVDSKEGCLTYSKTPEITIQRWNKCEVEYQKLEGEDGGLSDTITENLEGKRAKIFQHEIDHFDCEDIYKKIKKKG